VENKPAGSGADRPVVFGGEGDDADALSVTAFADEADRRRAADPGRADLEDALVDLAQQR